MKFLSPSHYNSAYKVLSRDRARIYVALACRLRQVTLAERTLILKQDLL